MFLLIRVWRVIFTWKKRRLLSLMVTGNYFYFLLTLLSSIQSHLPNKTLPPWANEITAWQIDNLFYHIFLFGGTVHSHNHWAQWSGFEPWAGTLCSIYQYSNMAPRLSGQTCIFGVVFIVSKSRLAIDRQKKLPKYTICPESLGAMLEYWYIKRRLLYSLACEQAPSEVGKKFGKRSEWDALLPHQTSLGSSRSP